MLMYKSTLRFFAVLTSRRLLLRSALQDSSSLNQPSARHLAGVLLFGTWEGL